MLELQSLYFTENKNSQMILTCATIVAGAAALGYIIVKWCRRPSNEDDDHEEQIESKEI
jgi:DhnA family fructose-bisphosphate aldolase class Ia